jgi:hypothetical protein
VRPHTAARNRALLEHFNWVLLDQPPYIPDLTPSDYNLFTYLKNWLRSQGFNNIDLMEGVKKCIPRYDKCPNSGGDYVEKQLKYVITVYNKNCFLIVLLLHNEVLHNLSTPCQT